MQFYPNSRRVDLLAACATATLGLLTIVVSGAMAQTRRGPLSEADLIRALRGDIPPQRVEALVREYGISFQLTPQAEAELRRAGATDELLKVIRETAPALPAAGSLTISSTSAGEQVYVDDKLVGTTNAKGALDLRQLSPGRHTLRVTLTGYEDYTQTVNVTAGESTSVLVTLTALPTVPVEQPGASAVHLVATFRVTHQHLIGSCDGSLIIGHGVLEYRADNQGRDSFESLLRDITYGGSKIGGGFYLRTKDGKLREFHSKSMTEIFQILAYPTNYQ